METIAIGSAIAGAATVITIVAVHEATERQRQVAQEQGHFAQQLNDTEQGALKSHVTSQLQRYVNLTLKGPKA